MNGDITVIEKLSTFQGNNAITATAHLTKFARNLVWCQTVTQKQEDVYMRLFALALEEDAYDWFVGLDANSYSTYDDFTKGFLERWGEKKSLVIS